MKLNKGYQIARLLTKSKVSDEQIEKELSSMTALEWDRICNILDNFLKAHDMPLDQGWALMINDIKLYFKTCKIQMDLPKHCMKILVLQWHNNFQSLNFS